MMNKKWLSLLSMVLLSMALVSCAGKYQTVEGDDLGTQIYTLDNGLKVFMSVNKKTPRIQTYIAVKVGGKNDPAETTGLAHYFEHLMFKGTQQFGTSNYEEEKPLLDEIETLFETYRKTTDEAERAAIYHRIDSVSYEASKLSIANEYDKLMAVIGASGTNAWTSQDETVYTEEIPSNQIDNWARIQADRFRNIVIRGFHTELETIYEEKNMSLTKDSRKVYEALDKALFPNHPYGKQTVLGTQDHLKNPSITNVKNYHDQYYVPNNIAICVSGDFNPDEMVAAIEKYFGDWAPNPNVPKLEYEPEKPITEPVISDVYGLEAENMAMAWRLPGAADLQNVAVADIASSIVYNGQAGLLDLDVNQQQKALFMYAGNQTQPDYGSFLLMARPKQGQTLEQLRDIALEEVAKLRSGDFDEALVQATVNNIKLSKMQQLEENSSRAVMYVDAFINGIDWADAAKAIARYEKVTKDDVVAWANEFLKPEAYVMVNKRVGEDTTVHKVTAPPITPIVTNRDKVSNFLTEIQKVQVNPIEPVYLDFSKEMSKVELYPGVELLYKKNELNDVASVDIVFNKGTEADPAMAMAFDYINYLGTATNTAEQLAMKMYQLACTFSMSASAQNSVLSLTGLSENLPEAIRLLEDLAKNAVANDEILQNVKHDELKARADAKLQQASCFRAFTRYMKYGKDYVRKTVLTNDAVMALNSDELLEKVRNLFTLEHRILYYGPQKLDEVQVALKENHVMEGTLTPMPESFPEAQRVTENNVLLAQYDAKQLYYDQYSNRGEKFDPGSEPVLDLYDEYFGGGMNSIVFQEMREARGLAYSANARLSSPRYINGDYTFDAFIATQNDKMQTAIEAFGDIINNMPQSESAFNVAKNALTARLRTQRTTGLQVLYSYVNCQRLGLEAPMTQQVLEGIQDMTLDDVKAAQEKWVKNRTYTYGILGDIQDLDLNYLKTLGPVNTVTIEDMFGY